MKLMKPKFWENISFFSIILLPITFIVEVGIIIRKKLVKKRKFDLPIICIGNIYIGGTGKTPLAVFLGNELSKYGRNPAIIRKFYKSHLDEHKLIKDKFKYLYLNKYRQKAIIEAQKNNHDSIILDDGFQDFSIKPNLSILCFNSKQLVGNGFTIPSGPLRENFSSIRRVDCIFINGEKNLDFENKIKDVNSEIKIFYTKYKLKNLNKFKNKQIIAFAGIGNPQNFFDLLKLNNINVRKTISFPDHHNYSESDYSSLITVNEKDLLMVTTEKDHYRLNEKMKKSCDYVEIDLEIENKNEFINLIKSKL